MLRQSRCPSLLAPQPLRAEAPEHSTGAAASRSQLRLRSAPFRPRFSRLRSCRLWQLSNGPFCPRGRKIDLRTHTASGKQEVIAQSVFSCYASKFASLVRMPSHSLHLHVSRLISRLIDRRIDHATPNTLPKLHQFPIVAYGHVDDFRDASLNDSRPVFVPALNNLVPDVIRVLGQQALTQVLPCYVERIAYGGTDNTLRPFVTHSSAPRNGPGSMIRAKRKVRASVPQ